MKKFIALLLALMMVLSLAACGDGENPAPTDGGNAPNVNNQQTEPDETEGGNNAPVASGKISLDSLMKAPANPESDFICVDSGDGEVILLEYTGTSDTVVIPETWDGRKVVEIASYVFANATPVKAIRLADSIRVISDSAFGLNTSLELVVCGESLEEIGAGVFQNCTNLKEVVLNDGLVKLGEYSFSGVDSLKSLEIPATVTDIHYAAFYNLPDGFEIIGEAGSAAEAYANSEGIAFKAK